MNRSLQVAFVLVISLTGMLTAITWTPPDYGSAGASTSSTSPYHQTPPSPVSNAKELCACATLFQPPQMVAEPADTSFAWSDFSGVGVRSVVRMASDLDDEFRPLGAKLASRLRAFTMLEISPQPTLDPAGDYARAELAAAGIDASWSAVLRPFESRAVQTAGLLRELPRSRVGLVMQKLRYFPPSSFRLHPSLIKSAVPARPRQGKPMLAVAAGALKSVSRWLNSTADDLARLAEHDVAKLHTSGERGETKR